VKNNKTFLVVVGVLALIAFAGTMFWSKSTDKAVSSSGPKVDSAILIKEHSPVKGSKDAKVTIVEFLDPECEACRAMHPIIKTLMGEYDGKIKLVIRYMPLHGNSRIAALSLEEAREQGKYDEALNTLFERQPEWADHAQPRPEMIPVLLGQLGISKLTLESSTLNSKHGWKVDLDQADGEKAGVRFTPTFFVNGEMLNEIGYGPVKQAIDKALAQP